MRIIHANCSVKYEGRGSTKLAPYDRVIMVKDDNSVLIHNENGIKPLNYMTGIKSEFSEIDDSSGEKFITFDSNKESLRVTLHKIHSEINFEAPVTEDSGLERDGTEEQLQLWLSENLPIVIPTHSFVQREHNTGVGPVDLLAVSNDSERLLLIEVKRVATRAAVHQVKRYWDEYIENINPNAHAILLALSVRPSAREFAEKKGIPWVEINWNPHGKSSVKESWFPENWDSTTIVV